MNTFNNAIADITRYYHINAAVKGDIARMQVPAQDALAIFKWVREHTTGTWWTAEDDIINVYADEYNFVISKRSGNITITDMMLPGTMAGAVCFDIEQGGLFRPERSYAMSPAMAAPYGTQGKEVADYLDGQAVMQVTAANIAHALDAERNNCMLECIESGFTYAFYCDYMMQRVASQFVEVCTVTEREYNAAAMAFAKKIADLDSAL